MAPPEILFKYRPLGPTAKPHTLRTISHREIRFSSAAEFNDPFEARVSISMEGDDADWEREFSRRRPAESELARAIPDFEEGIRQKVERLGVFCLSGKRDDILMWSHYSDKHQGVCLGFRTTEQSILSDARPVEYREAYPVVPYLHMTPEQRVRMMILTKARHWEYEQEYRVFRAWVAPGIQVYPAGMLAQVILGCQIAPSDCEEIIAVASALPAPPEIYQAKRSTSEFRLELSRIK